MQSWFTGWLKRGGGAGFGDVRDAWGGALVYKIPDIGEGIKPFDCFVIGSERGSWLYRRGIDAAGFELKLGSGGTVPYSELLKGTRAAQLTALAKCVGMSTTGFYVFGFDRGESGCRVYVVLIGEVTDLLVREGMLKGKIRGSVKEAWCEEKGERVL